MCKDCGCPAEKGSQVRFHARGYDNGNVKAIEKSLLGLPGVYHVHIHAHDGQTTIDYDPAKTPLADIAALLTSRGVQAAI